MENTPRAILGERTNKTSVSAWSRLSGNAIASVLFSMVVSFLVTDVIFAVILFAWYVYDLHWSSSPSVDAYLTNVFADDLIHVGTVLMWSVVPVLPVCLLAARFKAFARFALWSSGILLLGTTLVTSLAARPCESVGCLALALSIGVHTLILFLSVAVVPIAWTKVVSHDDQAGSRLHDSSRARLVMMGIALAAVALPVLAFVLAAQSAAR